MHGDWMVTWRRLTRGGEDLEHSGGARLREGLMGTHRLGLERTRSMNLNRFEKRPVMGSEKGAMNSTTVMDKGPGVKNSQN